MAEAHSRSFDRLTVDVVNAECLVQHVSTTSPDPTGKENMSSQKASAPVSFRSYW